VRAVLEAAEQARAQAEAEAERTRATVGRVGERADELSSRLDELAAAVAETVAALRAELAALRREAADEDEAEPLEVPAAEQSGGDDPLIAEVEAVAAREPDVEAAGSAPEGARLLALKMALDGRPREETAAYLRDNFELEDPEALLDEVYAQVGS
jgi:hypothetical protein